MDLRGKTIALTGAAQGLGQSMAIALAEQGAQLALVDLSEDKVVQTAELCAEKGAETRSYGANVADEEAVQRLFQAIVQDFGRLDGLVNNAGTNSDGLLVKAKDGDIQSTMSRTDFDKVIAVDLTGVFLCGREAAVQMIKGKAGGVIVNISSIARAGNAGQTNYAAAKSGVAAMTVTWAKELARYNIRVAGIAPGFCETAMTAKMKPEILDKIISGIPLKRLGQPEEIGHAARFVFENNYYNGRILEIDGGLRL